MSSCTGARKKWPETGNNNKKYSIAFNSFKILESISRTIKGNYTCRAGATGLFADPSSCSIYHWCILGVLQSSHHCNLGLHFSASASGCILPKDAECKSNSEDFKKVKNDLLI